jgi:hypothetical protein
MICHSERREWYRTKLFLMKMKQNTAKNITLSPSLGKTLFCWVQSIEAGHISWLVWAQQSRIFTDVGDRSPSPSFLTTSDGIRKITLDWEWRNLFMDMYIRSICSSTWSNVPCSNRGKTSGPTSLNEMNNYGLHGWLCAMLTFLLRVSFPIMQQHLIWSLHFSNNRSTSL